MTRSEEQGFLDAIVAEPGNDAHRLIYADWLEERGVIARAEFIRTQVERARLPEWDPRQLPLQLRERELLGSHESKWRRELPRIDGFEWGEFRRGFMATAEVSSVAALRENVSECWAATPLEAISIPWPEDEDGIETIDPIPCLTEITLDYPAYLQTTVQRFARAPLLSTIRRLIVPGIELDPARLAELLGSPYLDNLKAFHSRFNFIGSGGLSTICDAFADCLLEELELTVSRYQGPGPVTNLSTDEIRKLAEWPGLRGIRSLTLNGSDPGADGLRALLQSPFAGELKELHLQDCNLKDSDFEPFREAREDLTLNVLTLGHNTPGQSGVRSLANANCLSDLKVLQLQHCSLDSGHAKLLADALFIPGLYRLNLDWNQVGPGGLRAILTRGPASMNQLSLYQNALGDEGITFLAGSAAAASIQEMDLSMNGLGTLAARALGTSNHLKNLLSLRITFDQISEQDLLELTSSPLGQRLAQLRVDEEVPF